jgi:hypothetical protein
MRFALLMVLVAVCATGCKPARRPMSQPPMMQPMPMAPDNRAAEAYSRCDAELKAQPAIMQGQRAEAAAALASQRLALVTQLETTKAQAKVLTDRAAKARKSIHERAQSEFERAQIAGALLDIDEGREPQKALPNRLKNREEFRDSVEARALIRQNREARSRLEAQIAALDVISKQLNDGIYPASVLPAPIGAAAAAAAGSKALVVELKPRAINEAL